MFPVLAELEAEVQVDAAGNPNNKVAFAEEKPEKLRCGSRGNHG